MKAKITKVVMAVAVFAVSPAALAVEACCAAGAVCCMGMPCC